MPQLSSTRSRSQRWVVTLVMVALVLLMILSRRQNEMGYFLSSTDYGEELSDTSTTTLEQDKIPDSSDAHPPKPIRQISILGERNSGTRWTFEYVSIEFFFSQHLFCDLHVPDNTRFSRFLQPFVRMFRTRPESEKGTNSVQALVPGQRTQPGSSRYSCRCSISQSLRMALSHS